MNNFKEKNITILYIITQLSTGGAEIMLLKLLERIDRSRFSPIVISLKGIGEIGFKISELDIPVESLNMNRNMPNLLDFLRLVVRLKKIKPDILHTWLYHSNLIGGMASKLAGIPVLIWGIHASGVLLSNTNLLTKLTLWCCTKLSLYLPDCIQYVSNHAKRYHEELGYSKSNSLVIPNGVDLNEFKPDDNSRKNIRRELGISETTPLIGNIGRFDPIKNQEGFIEAAKYLHQKSPEIHFLMAGQSVNWSNPILNSLITKMNLNDVFHLLGNREDISNITASLDLVCLTSWSEAFGIVLIEAMASGVPCVSTDCGEQKLILGDTGWIVPKGDMENLAARCEYYLSLPKTNREAIGKSARQRVMNFFDVNSIVKQYEDLYLKYYKSEQKDNKSTNPQK